MFETYITAREAWESMLSDCRNAQRRIYFEQYILDSFGEDSIGDLFLDVFKQKAQEGVDVRILVDMIGSFTLFTSSLVDELRDAGVHLQFFGLLPEWSQRANFLLGLIHRDHRKLLIVDDFAAHIGGVVIRKKMDTWHDYHGRFEGEHVHAFAEVFEDTWEGVQNEHVPTTERVACSSDDTLLVVNSPKRRCLYEDMLEHIHHAGKHITIVTPYFSPNPSMLRALYDAAHRGVEVSVVLSGKTDTKLADMTSRSYVTHLLRHGIYVYFYTSTVNHAKIVIADNWATFGSCNFDRLSFLHNYELNLTTSRQEYVTHITNDVRHFMDASEKVVRRVWRRRPFFERWKSYAGYFLRPFA